MKYKQVTIKEDKNIFKNKTDGEISKLTGFTREFINMLRHKKRIATSKTYLKIKDKLCA
jgi:hypothetical protein